MTHALPDRLHGDALVVPGASFLLQRLGRGVDKERYRQSEASVIHRVYNSAMRKLFLLFILVPVVELALLIELGSRLGTAPTLMLLLIPGFLGAFLARRQGLSVLRAAHEQMQRGELPAGSVADGILILLAAALLITPGVLTDCLGFLLLVPAFRNRVKATLASRFRRGVEERRIRFYAAGFGPSPFDPEAYSAEPDAAPPYKIH